MTTTRGLSMALKIRDKHMRDGIHAFCITTITEKARDYLPHMYGTANYTVIGDITKLPLKVSDIYRRITT